MRLFTLRTFLEVLSGILENLTSGWLGVVIVAPGFFGASSLNEYLNLLTVNIPLGIVGLVATLLLKEKSRKV